MELVHCYKVSIVRGDRPVLTVLCISICGACVWGSFTEAEAMMCTGQDNLLTPRPIVVVCLLCGFRIAPSMAVCLAVAWENML